MGQIEELQGRIAAALDRISQGLDLQANTLADPEDIAAMREALDEEKVASEQRKERNKALHARVEQLKERNKALHARVEELEAQQSATSPELSSAGDLSGLKDELSDLRSENERMRKINARLRAANEQNVGEPHLINSGVMAELDSLRAARKVDRAEMAAILTALEAAIGSDNEIQGDA